MSNTEKPPDAQGECPARGRRRAASRPKPRSQSRQRGAQCPTSTITRGEPTDEQAKFDIPGGPDAFAHWFADWWLRRGRELTAAAAEDAR